MQTRPNMSSVFLAIALVACLVVASACDDEPCQQKNEIDLVPFKDLARLSPCAETRNRLSLIDDELVFWDRAGDCPDWAYSEILFGGTVEEVLCSLQDSIGGPRRLCPADRYSGLFDTITANHDQPDLGLGAGHRVVPMPF